MKQYNNLTSIVIIISVALFLLSYFFYGGILEILLPVTERGSFQVVEEDPTQVSVMLIFCFVVALIPVFIAATWVFSPIVSPNYRLLSVLLIIGCVLLALFIRYESIKNYFLMTTSTTMFNVSFPFVETNYEYYMLGGLCAGFIISYAFLRQKQVRP